MNCPCFEHWDLRAEPSIRVLDCLRENCPAVRLFLPANIWSEFERWHQQPDDVATHRSILLLALERGYLATLTSPVHRFLLNGLQVRPEVQEQYVKDLAERWMYYTDPAERHRKSRIFRGRLAELVCAEWLQALGWTILGLEALGCGPDVVARSRDGAATAFEIKFIGTEDCDFQMILAAIAGRPAGGSVSPYAAINYLLLRTFEAAHQLQTTHGRRIAVVIVEDLTWWRFDLQLKNNWIDWRNPVFLAADVEWSTFLELQKKRYPELPSVAPEIRAIDRVWIVRQSSEYHHDLEYDISMSSA